MASPSSVRISPSVGVPGGPQRIVPMCCAVSSSESPRSRLSRITAFTPWKTSLNLLTSGSGVSPASRGGSSSNAAVTRPGWFCASHQATTPPSEFPTTTAGRDATERSTATTSAP